MSDTTYDSQWATYQDAWANVTPERRQELLLQSIAALCDFTAPNGVGRGLSELTKHIEAFQVQYPGFFFKTLKFLHHHSQALAEWTMYDGNGEPALQGTSYARFDAEGKLIQLTGFWEI